METGLRIVQEQRLQQIRIHSPSSTAEILQRCKSSKVSIKATENTFSSLLVEFQEKSDQQTRSVAVYEIHNQVTFPDELIFKILLFVPARFLLRIQFVCKRWFDMINSSFFITFHAKQSETVLITRTRTLRNPNPKPSFHVLDLDCNNDMFVKSIPLDILDILASYDGLILARMEGKNNSLTLINPVTRKHVEFPLGVFTLFNTGTYSLTFCNKAKSYKVVHLFCDKRGSGCEILDINTKIWKVRNDMLVVPLQNIRQTHVSIGGLLYWVFASNCTLHLLIMNVQDEKSTTKELPTVCVMNYNLVEIGGVLGLVTQPTHSVMQVWIIDEDNGNWVMRHDIDLNFKSFGYCPTPVCCSRDGKEIIFLYLGGRELYSYNFNDGELNMVYSTTDITCWHYGLWYTHRNTLVSWS